MMDHPNDYDHDYHGSLDPKHGHTGWGTFSVGVFQWIPRASGIGLKRSAAKVRVTGPTHDPEAAYRVARAVVKALDAGTYDGPKNLSPDSPWAKANTGGGES